MRARRGLLIVAALVAVAPAVRADIYSWTDPEGTVHFTNIPPRGKGRWKKILVQPDKGTKAAAVRGSCERCDLIPAKDRTPQRLHRYDDLIFEAAEVYRIPVPLIRAVIHTESDYDPAVVSSAGARGLMQLMPAVVEDMRIGNVHDPRENILAGTRLLRVLANRYDGDLVLTIAAYHAGPGSLAKYGNTVPPYVRTRQYLRMVLDRYYQYRDKEARERASGG